MEHDEGSSLVMHDDSEVREEVLNPTRVRRQIKICTRCELSSQLGVTPVPWRGKVPSRIAVVGESPDYDDNAEGQPFVGASGRLISGMLEENGIDLEEVAWMNIVSCFIDGTPSVGSQKACRIHLRNQLELADPRWILFLGATALRFYDKDLTITEARGSWQPQGDRSLFFTFHPDAALRDPERHELFKKDVAKFCRMVLAE